MNTKKELLERLNRAFPGMENTIASSRSRIKFVSNCEAKPC